MTGKDGSTGELCAEVHEGDLVVDGDSDLGALEKVVAVSGNVTLDGVHAPDLEFLGCLEEIGGAVFIQNNDELRTLEGAGQLRSLDSLFVEGNAQLQSLSGLSGLTTAPGGVIVMGNPLLTDLGMSALEEIGGQGLVLGGCVSLVSDEPAQGLGNNASLESFGGFDSLRSVRAVHISGQEKLRSLDHFTVLAEQGTDFGSRITVQVTPELALGDIQSFVEASGFENVNTCQNKDNPELCNCPPD